jgi:hypothetical protein
MGPLIDPILASTALQRICQSRPVVDRLSTVIGHKDWLRDQ